MPTNRKHHSPATGLVSREPAAMLGDLAGLAEQIGSTEALASLAETRLAPGFSGIDSVPALADFLRRYHQEILAPLELPVIHRAYQHTSRYQVRELITLDHWLAREPRMQGFSTASRRVGWSHLRRLRPLRDQRLVQRYVRAVEDGEACGWHTLVYGMILAVYSLPLRQGLLNYGLQTTLGFVNAAGRTLRFSEAVGENLVAELTTGLPAAVESLLRDSEPVARAPQLIR